MFKKYYISNAMKTECENIILDSENEEIIETNEIIESLNTTQPLEDFTPLLVSTTTVTAVFKQSINIVDVAKYLPLDSVVIGIKLVYAGGSSTIIRGVARISKKKKDFYNQVTFTLRLPVELLTTSNSKTSSILVSCKIFHNGTLHVTGTHTLEEASVTSNLLLKRLREFKGSRIINIKDFLYLNSHDNILFSSNGNIIGWSNKNANLIYLKNEYVILESLNNGNDENNQESTWSFPVFVSTKWIDNKKTIYTLDGVEIGTRQLEFTSSISKRHFDVKYGTIFSGNNIVGKEIIKFVENYFQRLEQCDKYRLYLLENKKLVHCYRSFPDEENAPKSFPESAFIVHMINTFFKAPFKICRKKLHKCLLDNGYYSRFDPCSNAAVNLRFHYNIETLNDPDTCGKCLNLHKRACNCKDISISCFNSGKMNVTGLATIEQGVVVYNFLKKFFIDFQKDIQSEV